MLPATWVGRCFSRTRCPYRAVAELPGAQDPHGKSRLLVERHRRLRWPSDGMYGAERRRAAKRRAVRGLPATGCCPVMGRTPGQAHLRARTSKAGAFPRRRPKKGRNRAADRHGPLCALSWRQDRYQPAHLFAPMAQATWSMCICTASPASPSAVSQTATYHQVSCDGMGFRLHAVTEV